MYASHSSSPCWNHNSVMPYLGLVANNIDSGNMIDAALESSFSRTRFSWRFTSCCETPLIEGISFVQRPHQKLVRSTCTWRRFHHRYTKRPSLISHPHCPRITLPTSSALLPPSAMPFVWKSRVTILRPVFAWKSEGFDVEAARRACIAFMHVCVWFLCCGPYAIPPALDTLSLLSGGLSRGWRRGTAFPSLCFFDL